MNTLRRHLGYFKVTDDNIEKLKQNIWITKGARFNAYRRLSRKNHASIFSVSILSFYNIGIALFPNIAGTDLASPLSVAVSVFILIISLLEAGKGYAVKAERLHQNAVDLSHLLNEIELKDKISQDDKEKFYNQYHRLIKNCPENHSPCDNKLFRTEHPHNFDLEYTLKITRPFVTPSETIEWKIRKPAYYYDRILFLLGTYWLYAVLIITPLLLILFYADSGAQQ